MTLPQFVTDPRTGDGPFPRYAFCFAVYNAVGTIEPLLASLARQRESGIPFEAIACDDCSTDRTPELLAEHDWLTVVANETNSGPSVARNNAALASTADILIFLDADVVLEPDTLQQIDRFLTEHPDCGAFHWPMSADVLAPGPVGLYKTLLDRHMTRMQRPGTHPATFWSCRGGMIRREHFFAAGGFDPRYRKADVEDWELSRRISQVTTILHTDRFTIKHHQAPDFATNFKNYFRRAFLFLRLLAKSKQMDNYTETTPLNSLATVGTLPGLLGLIAGGLLCGVRLPVAGAIALGVGGAFLLLFTVVNAGLFLYAARERGLAVLPLVFCLRLIFSLAVACGVALAILLWPLGGWPFTQVDNSGASG